MTWDRALWLVVGLVMLAGVALVVPASPAYLPKLLTAGGTYDGHPTRHWVKALDDPNVEGRRHAIVALGAIGTDAAGAVPRLGTILREDADARSRNEAAAALGKMGPAALPALPDVIGAVADPDGFVRMSAINTLRGLRTDARPAVPALILALRDERNKTNLNAYVQTIQEAAAVTLGFVSAGSDEAVPALREALKGSPRAEMRGAVVRALREIGPPAKPAEPELRTLLKDEYEDVRLDAEETLKVIAGETPEQSRR